MTTSVKFLRPAFLRIPGRIPVWARALKVQKTGPLGQGMAGGPGNFELIQT